MVYFHQIQQSITDLCWFSRCISSSHCKQQTQENFFIKQTWRVLQSSITNILLNATHYYSHGMSRHMFETEVTEDILWTSNQHSASTMYDV